MLRRLEPVHCLLNKYKCVGKLPRFYLFRRLLRSMSPGIFYSNLSRNWHTQSWLASGHASAVSHIAPVLAELNHLEPLYPHSMLLMQLQAVPMSAHFQNDHSVFYLDDVLFRFTNIVSPCRLRVNINNTMNGMVQLAKHLQAAT